MIRDWIAAGRAAAFLVAAVVSLAAVAATGESPSIVLVEGRLEVEGLVSSAPDALPPFDVFVESENQPAIAGTVTRSDSGSVVFEPRFPFVPGVSYLAVLAAPGRDTVRHPFSVPDTRTPGPPTRVEAIYPSGPEVPPNLLRFYLHFSAPMTRGRAYDFIQLRDHRGEPVEDAFLVLDEELWDPSGRRFTLLFDPGRIKSGLVPRIELGAALNQGHHFELIIDGAWPDATGRPLVGAFRHRFRAGGLDDAGTDPQRWRLTPPSAGTRDALLVQFDEPLDRALALRLIDVVRSGQYIDGSKSVGEQETQWQFTPTEPWSANRHELIVDVRLEDRAGNRIDRPFERLVTSESPDPAGPGSERTDQVDGSAGPIAVPFTPGG